MDCKAQGEKRKSSEKASVELQQLRAEMLVAPSCSGDLLLLWAPLLQWNDHCRLKPYGNELGDSLHVSLS